MSFHHLLVAYFAQIAQGKAATVDIKGNDSKTVTIRSLFHIDAQSAAMSDVHCATYS